MTRPPTLGPIEYPFSITIKEDGHKTPRMKYQIKHQTIKDERNKSHQNWGNQKKKFILTASTPKIVHTLKKKKRQILTV
jgi:hypothetical protein